ncbi:MAG: DMT family transporter [Aliivibrio sp.]|uniref:DMT family transporter n=1 Tax=Aliivibrio sp. TaxID=1872443 RepID=UPI001A58A2A2|nr:DMT family transporter [Aliivibrio sp.]
MIYLLPLISVLIWGGNAIVNKMSVSVIEPSAMSFYRWFIAFLILTPFCLRSVLKHRKVIKPHLGKLAVLASLGMGLHQSLGYFAAVTTSASNLALITSLVPLISLFLSVPLLGKRLSKMSLVGASVALIGLCFMLGHGDVLFFLHSTINQGDGIMLVAAVVYALYGVLIKRWSIPLTNWQLIYMQVSFAVIFLFPLLLTSDSYAISESAFSVVAYASIAASIIAPWCWIKAIDRIGADNSAMFMNLMPVFAVSLAALILGEEVHSYHFVGGLMVIVGVVMTQLKLFRKKGGTVTV